MNQRLHQTHHSTHFHLPYISTALITLYLSFNVRLLRLGFFVKSAQTEAPWLDADRLCEAAPILTPTRRSWVYELM